VFSQLNEAIKRGDVKNGPFWVLKNNTVPAVLLEVGFLSNALALKSLNSLAGQKEIAQNIFKGLLEITN
jgi:N-acetylmuramoyl-L-alanine amidase